jgi:iron complex outermembrane recepter protein
MKSTKILRSNLMCRAGLAAILAPFLFAASTTAHAAESGQVAQPPEAEEPARAGPVEPVTGDIVVTGSRIDRAGFAAPTPMTVIGEEELRQAGRTNIGAVLNDLPHFRATQTPQTLVANINSAISGADLRSLGPARNLVLLEGKRFVGAGDLNSIPFMLVQRVEVVTGGASAAWGSGAVAGVTNILLDDSRDGVSLLGQAGISSRGDGARYMLGVAAGTNFADGKGNVSLSAEFVDDKGVRPMSSRPNVGRWGLVSNPAWQPGGGEPQFIFHPDVRLSIVSDGGLILSGSLAGNTFQSDGSLRPFQFGTPISPFQMVGGEGPSGNDLSYLSAPLERINLFGRAHYWLSDAVRLSGDVRYSRTYNNFQASPDSSFGNIFIRRDNAFLSQNIRDHLLSTGEQGFAMGRWNADFGSIDLTTERQTIQGSIQLDGTLGPNWRWDAYYTYGESVWESHLGRIRITSNFAQAIDSVIHPTTGQPVCRIALTNPATDCVPLNPFGIGNASPASLNYALGTASNYSRTKLQVGAASLRGEPFSLWAGPVSVALGGEAWRTSIHTEIDPLSANNRFAILNFTPLEGAIDVKEGFGEVLVPLARDLPFAQLLEFNAAARVSDYTHTGSIWTWKIGGNWQVIPDVRLRAVRSRDMRAPTLFELFTERAVGLITINDPLTGQSFQVTNFTGGNVNLRPEISDTFSFGGVLQPSFIPGLSISADYYDINIKDAISTLPAQAIVNRCVAGNQAMCALVVRDANNRIIETHSPFINLNSFHTSGVDFELLYRVPVARLALPGNLQFRIIGNYVEKLRIDDGVGSFDNVGNLGPGVAFGIPRWRATASANYQVGNFGLDLRARHIPGGSYNDNLDIHPNEISSRTYVDLGVQFRIPSIGDDRFTWFANVANLFDRSPPIAPNPMHYDLVGRHFTAGARVNF